METGEQGAFLEPIWCIFRAYSKHLINNISRQGFEKGNMGGLGACPLDFFLKLWYIRSISRAHLEHFQSTFDAFSEQIQCI